MASWWELLTKKSALDPLAPVVAPGDIGQYGGESAPPSPFLSDEANRVIAERREIGRQQFAKEQEAQREQSRATEDRRLIEQAKRLVQVYGPEYPLFIGGRRVTAGEIAGRQEQADPPSMPKPAMRTPSPQEPAEPETEPGIYKVVKEGAAPTYTNIVDEDLQRAIAEGRATRMERKPSRGGYYQANEGLSVGPAGEIVNPGGGWVPPSVTEESVRRQEQVARERATADPYGIEALRARSKAVDEESQAREAEALEKHAAAMKRIQQMKPEDQGAAKQQAEKALADTLSFIRLLTLQAKYGAFGVKLDQRSLEDLGTR